MSSEFRIGYIILVVTIMLVALVFFVVFSIVQYQKAHGNHIDEMSELRSSFQKEMLSSQLDAQKKTLDNVSSELHDNIGQILSVAKLNLYQVKKKQPSENVTQSIEQIDMAITGIRNVSHLISGNKLIDKSLEDLLMKEIDQLNKTGAMIGNLTWDDEIGNSIGPEKSFMIYRIVQESINNTIKHGRAKNIDIQVKNQGDDIELSIKDDGVGFVVNQKVLKSNGLQNLNKRASVIDADLKITSAPNKGTTIVIKVIKDLNDA